MSATISTVTGELVKRGIPLVPFDASADAMPPSGWAVMERPADAPEHAPRQSISLYVSHRPDGEDAALIRAHTCSCCDRIVRVDLLDADHDLFASLAFWPGLDRALRIHRRLEAMAWESLEAEADG